MERRLRYEREVWLMGACHNKGSATYITKDRNAQGGSSDSSIAIQGTDFVSFAPTALSDQRERVITLTENGDYIYSRKIPNFDDVKIDTSSAEYKRALRDFNVKAQFNADGSVSVASGGLFSRKQKFKNTGDFQKETYKKIDNNVSYWKSEENRVKSGKLTQLEAENIKSTVKGKSKSMAIKEINNGFKEQITQAKTYTAAGDDMKRRLSAAISNAKK